jgi:DNA helicase II / ATP-dependent DNA helicase PcrA
VGVERRDSDDALWGDEPVPQSTRVDTLPLLEGLTDEQSRAVTHDRGPLLIVAGAGSGKTRVLTRRIAYLLATGAAQPHEILAITFTNKAADEMRHRVSALVGDEARTMWVATFHSACLRMLRAHGTLLGFAPGFTIYDAGEAESTIDRLLKDRDVDTKKVTPRSVAAAISAAKNERISPEAYLADALDERRRLIGDVYRRYVARLKDANAMDFDDILLYALALLVDHPEVRARYQQRFRYVLVDEFQDTNTVQNDIVTVLAAEHRNICVVGDSDQSIYRFRAADVRNILEFEERFPDATVVLLEENFRSTQIILNAANAVISRNTNRHAKRLFTRAGQGSPIRRIRAATEYDEGRAVVKELLRWHDEYRVPFGAMAVFYRTNAQSRVLEEECARAGLPYRVMSGQRFYDRKEVKTALAYARLLVNPRDEAAGRRVINEPKRGLGEAAQAKLSLYAQDHGLGFAQAADVAQAAGLTGRALAGARAFSDLLEELRARANDLGPGEVITDIVALSGMGAELEAEKTDEARGRLENLSELASAAAQYGTLEEFLERMALIADSDQIDDGSGAVSLMTMHVAKGLEFDAVVVTGLEEGIFPHQRALADADELEEERRLCYVALTRARHHLSLAHAWTRSRWGESQDTLPSRFLEEIPSDDVVDLSSGPQPLRRSFSADDGFLGRSTEFTEGRAFGAGPAPRVQSTGAEKLQLQPGERVIHDRYGLGTVVSVSRPDLQPRARVDFDHYGVKMLVLALTPLQRAPS